MEYKILKNVPFPVKKKAKRDAPKGIQSREKKYPFDEMNIGDCFMIGEHNSYKSTALSNASRSFVKYNKKTGWKFSVSMTDKGQIGIWRIS